MVGAALVTGRGDGARRLVRLARSPLADGAHERLTALTNRGREIPELFSEGLPYQEIGEIRRLARSGTTAP